MNAEIVKESYKLNPDTLVELYELDATAIGLDDALFFHNGVGVGNASVSFNGQPYTPLPIKVSGFDFSGSGSPPRPTLEIANVAGFVTSLLRSTNDLVGAKFTRRRTFAKYLDDGEMKGLGVQYDPDVYVVFQKTRETRFSVEFELNSGFDLDQVSFPVRKVVSGFCMFDYRAGNGCPFGGMYVVTNSHNEKFPGMLNFTGTFSYSRTYDMGESVTFTDGTTLGVYRCLVNDTIAIDPTNTNNWTRVQRFCGKYDPKLTYSAYDVVYTSLAGLPLYAIATQTVPISTPPPNSTYWSSDSCAKFIDACRARFDPLGTQKALPFGGFPGVINLPQL